MSLDLSPVPTSRQRLVSSVAKWTLAAAVCVWLLMGLALAVLHVWIVPRIGELRPTLEVQATRLLGVQVGIGAIRAQSTGLSPVFTLTDVSLRDTQGRETLRLPSVKVSASVASLLRLGVTDLHIDSPDLEVRLDAQGRLFVAGIELARSTSEQTPAADWVFSQDRLRITRGTVRFINEQVGAPELRFGAVDLRLLNDGRRHALSLQAMPPSSWGRALSAAAVVRSPLLSASPGRWQDWQGELFVQAAQIDLAVVREQTRLPVQIQQGQGALRLWLGLARGQISTLTADLALAQLAVVLRPDLPALALAEAQGRLSVDRLPDGFEAATAGLQFTTADGLRWPGGNLRWRQAGEVARSTATGEVQGDALDLRALAQLAARAPLDAALQATLAKLAPQGRVDQLKLAWRGDWQHWDTFDASGRLSNVAWRTEGAWPAARGLSLDFRATQAGGNARLQIEQGALDLPGVFRQADIPLDSLLAQLRWQRTAQSALVQIDQLDFANSDAAGSLSGSWQSAPAADRGVAPTQAPTPTSGRVAPGAVDLRGNLTRFNAAALPSYLPLAMNADARAYLEQAVVSGDVSDVSLRLRGDLMQFPFVDRSKGEFLVKAQVRNAEFAFAPQARAGLLWPRLTQAQARLVFEHERIEVSDITARLSGTALAVSQGTARIPTVIANRVVEVDARAQGPLADALLVASTTPLSEMLYQALDEATGSGNADLRLQLNIPLADVDRTRVQGSLAFSGNDLQIAPQTPVLSRVRGSLSFTETGFNTTALQVRLLGGDARIDGGYRKTPPRGEPELLLRAQGVMSAEGLRAARDMGALSRLGARMAGSTSYNASFGLRQGHSELQINSSLVGMALNLPEPLNKPAAVALPLRFDNSLLSEQPTLPQRVRDRFQLDLGELVSLDYERELQGGVARVLRGTVAIGLEPGEEVQMPASGVAANLKFKRVDLDAWSVLLDDASPPAATTAGSPPGRAAERPPERSSERPTDRVAARVAARATAAAAPLLTYLPNIVALRAEEIAVSQRRLRQVVVGGSREGLLWRANVNAEELNGYVEYRQPAGSGVGLVFARLARLSLAPSQVSDVERLLGEQPSAIPALDLVVEDLELRGRRFGRVEVDAVNRGVAAVAATADSPRLPASREWRLNKLLVTLPEASLSATGNWAALGTPGAAPVSGAPAPERRRTVMNFKLDISNSGALLERFGQPGVIRRGKGRMEGQVAWLGSPTALDTPSMTGRFNVNIEEGQFLKADPGIARLLGVLSLQSLPRRLALDFRDVFSEGFSFDFIRGDVQINQGVASTNNLQMKGVNAAVLMDGSADITRETQDLRVVVVPEINAGTASLVATVINPALGLGSFLAQLFLRRPLMEAATQEFRIDGSWLDPRVTKVERKAGVVEPNPGPPPAAPTQPATPAAPGASR